MHVQSHTYIKQVYLIRRQWRPAASSALCAVCLPSTQSLSSVDFHLCTCFAGPTKPTTYTQSPKQMRHANSANGNNHNHQQQHKKQQTQQQQTITTIVQQFNRSLCSWNQQKKCTISRSSSSNSRSDMGGQRCPTLELALLGICLICHQIVVDGHVLVYRRPTSQVSCKVWTGLLQYLTYSLQYIDSW